ncbi:hypothetical protein [Legionella nagasakiensis]|uniref:hypothetical protein n=1 Tax=Legionella nagasakiensis TaxID=535290 RepID=UPI001055748F|nr:hypothetical protein [Legionella nagasakiensis]
MNKSYLIIFLSFFFFLFSTGWAQEAVILKGDDSYWQCSAYDQENNQWIAKSPYERTAINKAYDACKKQSRAPKTCKTAKESCDAIVKGRNIRPMWRCTALDSMAKAWMSDIYRHRDDAALGAKAYCQQRSTVPASCYINLLTCKNLNAQ